MRSCARISATRTPCARSWSGSRSTPSCTSPPNRTSIARYWVRTISSARTWSARMLCSRRPRRSGSIGGWCPHIAFITSRRTRSTARCCPPMRRSTNRPPTRRILLTPRARPARTTWCGRIHADLISSRTLVEHHETSVWTTVTNCSNNYGPYQFPEKLIPLTLINILNGKPLPIYGDGLQVRDWLHVGDHCEAITLALAQGRPGQVYNIGGNSETTNIEVVRTLCGLADDLLGKDPALRAAFPLSPASKAAAPSISSPMYATGLAMTAAMRSTTRKAQRDLGYSPSRDLRSGLAGDPRVVPGQSRLVGGPDGPRLRAVARIEL